MSYKTEFNAKEHAEVPYRLRRKVDGWVDTSWHNDACPSFVNTKLDLRVWIGDIAKEACTDLYTVQRESVDMPEEKDILYRTDDPVLLSLWVVMFDLSVREKLDNPPLVIVSRDLMNTIIHAFNMLPNSRIAGLKGEALYTYDIASRIGKEVKL